MRDVGSVEFLGYEAGHVRLSIGSGSYAFTVDPTLGQIGDGAASVDPIRAAVKALDDAGALSKGRQGPWAGWSISSTAPQPGRGTSTWA
ncbi:hypothetical protein [Tessaracoccus coleopterorum]|uniref:hypothetical protein n=1 Tax=Tessaracoccus coleopterorum TaxID=2714950 RepID=UPI0018D45B79|nr:hypothetical protein [Tessaracoccus coleopterorum]